MLGPSPQILSIRAHRSRSLQPVQEWLRSIGADTSGLAQIPGRPTPRAWQIFEADGRRTQAGTRISLKAEKKAKNFIIISQVWRNKGDPCPALFEMLRPEFDSLPEHFKRAKSFHIGIHPEHPPMKLLRKLKQAS